MNRSIGPPPTLRCAIDAKTYLGETPIWSPAERALYWINCEREPMLSRWNAMDGERENWSMPERIGGVVLKETGGALVVLARGLHDFDFLTGELSLRVPSPLPEHISLHEVQCDRDGRLWVGSINHRLRDTPTLPGGGKLFRLDGDALVSVVEDINCANGLAFSPDGTRLYLSDSPTSIIESWTLDRATGSLSERQTFAKVDPAHGFVDGATVDSEGGYWATLVYGAALRRYAPDGAIDRHLALPFSNPTKVAFAGDDMRTLFITTTKMTPRSGKANLGQDMLGGIYAIESDIAGIPDPLWRGY
ncbi:SMP-30/gluconolactonase/LRE family protein [Novosphingopyxis sp.]|uniref:SMP-30/gluconolactonase/LRE family protein n=1 Tax=Novosphingopyxis sp. TaxID=2709690 RepID=UPI003B5B75DC